MSGVSIDPRTVDVGSLHALRDAFRSAQAPQPDDLVGEHRGEYVGPLWPRVTDELRPFGDGVLLGMTFGIPASPASGAPFLLRRIE